MTWKAVIPRGVVVRASSLRALWVSCGASATQVYRVGLGSSWACVDDAPCPEAWAVALREQTDLGVSAAGVLVERDDERPATLAEILDMETQGGTP